MNKKQLKIVTSVAIVVLILSILPILWIGQYLHPLQMTMYSEQRYIRLGIIPIPFLPVSKEHGM